MHDLLGSLFFGFLQMLMTRAMREKLKIGSKTSYTKSTVRIRLPEGLLLQGQFNAGENVSEIFNWVTDSLADPGTSYTLVYLNLSR